MKNIHQFKTHLSSLISEMLTERGGAIQISSPEGRIVIRFEQDKIITVTYETGSLKKVWHHTVNGCGEFALAGKEILTILLGTLKHLINWKVLLLKRKPLLIEHIKQVEHKS
ncbi:MAG: hypothetical protein JAY74_28295 [Candidatus Thiodiazotropha taylori]|nr:hypothetical protein [Candidatus Thiodiazotropha taylori]